MIRHRRRRRLRPSRTRTHTGAREPLPGTPVGGRVDSMCISVLSPYYAVSNCVVPVVPLETVETEVRK